jgi:hypothetical protein
MRYEELACEPAVGGDVVRAAGGALRQLCADMKRLLRRSCSNWKPTWRRALRPRRVGDTQTPEFTADVTRRPEQRPAGRLDLWPTTTGAGDLDAARVMVYPVIVLLASGCERVDCLSHTFIAAGVPGGLSLGGSGPRCPVEPAYLFAVLAVQCLFWSSCWRRVVAVSVPARRRGALTAGLQGDLAQSWLDPGPGAGAGTLGDALDRQSPRADAGRDWACDPD